ncbi:MAG: ABC transporter ATP-binding protein/permease, partial [Firmicutes bacterium]|nr:ABC transporter ATP-binding protein/permease [Bacillota bacterium]
MINLIPRLYDTCEGEVLIDGHNVKDLDMECLRSQISVVTQTATVFSGSVGTNIAQGNQAATYQDFMEASEKAVALEFIENYDDLFNHEIQQKGSNLSGGQKQRLSLARAFIRHPKILILDDSTSAVDAKSEEAILGTIKELSKNMTTLVISQKISTIKDMNKIIVLDTTGNIDGYDTHEQLLKTSKVYQEIASSQIGNGGDFDEIK